MCSSGRLKPWFSEPPRAQPSLSDSQGTHGGDQAAAPVSLDLIGPAFPPPLPSGPLASAPPELDHQVVAHCEPGSGAVPSRGAGGKSGTVADGVKDPARSTPLTAMRQGRGGTSFLLVYGNLDIPPLPQIKKLQSWNICVMKQTGAACNDSRLWDWIREVARYAPRPDANVVDKKLIELERMLSAALTKVISRHISAAVSLAQTQALERLGWLSGRAILVVV